MRPMPAVNPSKRRLQILACALALGGVSAGAGHVAASRGSASTPLVSAIAAAPATQSGPLKPFPAIGLPAGQAVGDPSKLSLPTGFVLKHVHGGPTYVYVLSGIVEIEDSDGTTAVYMPGEFFAEAPGHTHTVRVRQAAELFVLSLLAPGAEGTIPVP